MEAFPSERCQSAARLARSFTTHPIQSILDVCVNADILLEDAESLVAELVEMDMLKETQIDHHGKVYWLNKVLTTRERAAVEKGENGGERAADGVDLLSRLLAPYIGISEEALAKSKDELNRMQKSILVMKTQIASHPMTRKKKEELPDSVVSSKLLEIEIEKVEQDISKYANIIRAMLDELAEAYGTTNRDLLLKFGATRSVQNVLLM